MLAFQVSVSAFGNTAFKIMIEVMETCILRRSRRSRRQRKDPAPSTRTKLYADHHYDVRVVGVQVAHFYATETRFRIDHGFTNSTRCRDPNVPCLKIAHLNRILEIDIKSRIATVEPNVPLGVLVAEALKYGLVPLVVMEFPAITVGGGFSCASGESSGYKEGLFDCCIDEIEIIQGNGQVVQACKNGINSELFDAARCTLGTMGVVTLLKVRLTEAKDGVQLNYHHTTSAGQTIERLGAMCKPANADFDYIEAIQFGMGHGVIITGRRVFYNDEGVKELPVHRFDRAIDPWFYMHVRDTWNGYTDLVPTESYLFRHNRGAFWSGEGFLKYYNLPNTRVFRFLLNPIMSARAIYKAMHAADSADGAIVQDLLVPIDTAAEFVDYVDKELGIWPLWICPTLKKENADRIVGWPFHRAKGSSGDTAGQTAAGEDQMLITPVPEFQPELTLNFGVWGPTDPEPAAVCRTNRALEQKLRELRGMKIPYAANHYTEDEFWDLYDRDQYDTLRHTWRSNLLPSMYEKVRRTQPRVVSEQEQAQQMRMQSVLGIWPLGGLYQSYHALRR